MHGTIGGVGQDSRNAVWRKVKAIRCGRSGCPDIPILGSSAHCPLGRDPCTMKSKRFSGIRLPHVFVLLTGIILAASVLSYILPSGQFKRESRTVGTVPRTVVIPGSYTQVDKHFSLEGIFIPTREEGKASPVSLLQFLSAIPRGMEKTADIIFLIFLIGGVFGILQKTGTITAVLHALIQRFSASGPLLTVLLMVGIGVAGSTLGMGEEFIPLVPVFLYVSRELGYDRMFGLALIILSADVGFAAATTNPFTVQVAQGIAEVPIGSGLGFRSVFFAVCMAIAIGYLLWYGARVRRPPSSSLTQEDRFTIRGLEEIHTSLRPRHLWTVLLCALLFGAIIWAMQTQGWWLAEMSAGFLAMGIIAALMARLSLSETAKAFVKGSEEMVVAAMVVGFAKGIQVVMEDGLILDTLIHYAASSLQGWPPVVAAEGMFAFQSCLNFFIPSGSGQAAATMPVMTPLADLLGIPRSVAVFAFTCGDGFTNLVVPTSVTLMAMLAMADISYGKWLRFVAPVFGALVGASAIFLVAAMWLEGAL